MNMFHLKSCLVVLFLTTAFLSQEGVHSSSVSRWIKMNRHLVCLSGKGTRFGSFHNYVRSGLVAAIKLRHVFGRIRCAAGRKYNSYWGCNQYRGLKQHPIDIVVTDQYNHVLFPKQRYRMRKHGGMWYWVPFVSAASSKELILTDFANPFYFPKNKQMRIWYGEDLKNWYEVDNYGRVCVHVYAKFLN